MNIFNKPLKEEDENEEVDLPAMEIPYQAPEQYASLRDPFQVPDMSEMDGMENEQDLEDSSTLDIPSVLSEYDKIAQAQAADRESAGLAQMTNAFQKINESLANRAGITKIKHDPIKAQDNNLEDLLNSYKALAVANRGGSSELEQARIDKLKAETDRIKNAPAVSFEDREQKKEDAKIRTENRKERKQLEKDLQTWNTLEATIDDAIKKADKYNKGFGPGTGTLAVTKSYLGALAPETQALRTQLNKLSLDQLVKMFSGMSKAIDTPQERAAFESTVPSLAMDDELLMEELQKRKQAAQSAKARIKAGIENYDLRGNFINENVEPVEQVPGMAVPQTNQPTVGSIVRSNGKRYRVIDEEGTLEELK